MCCSYFREITSAKSKSIGFQITSDPIDLNNYAPRAEFMFTILVNCRTINFICFCISFIKIIYVLNKKIKCEALGV